MTLSLNILKSFVLHFLSARKHISTVPASCYFPHDLSLGHVYAHKMLSKGWGNDFEDKSHSDQT